MLMDDYLMDMDNWITDILPASVSDGDAGQPLTGTSVSGGDNITLYQIDVYTVSGSDQELQYTLFNKPLDEYTVSEGLLLILVIIAVGAVVWTAVKEGFRWPSW